MCPDLRAGQQDLAPEEKINGKLDCIVSTEAIDAVPAAESIIVTEEGEEISLDSGAVTVLAKKEEGTFPDISALADELAATRPEYVVTVDPKLLVAICRIAQAFGPNMTMAFRGAAEAIEIEAGDRIQSLYAILMPKRMTEEPPAAVPAVPPGLARDIASGKVKITVSAGAKEGPPANPKRKYKLRKEKGG